MIVSIKGGGMTCHFLGPDTETASLAISWVARFVYLLANWKHVIMWKDALDISVLSYSKNHIDVTVRLERGDDIWRFTCFYGKPKRNRRQESIGN